MSVIDMAYEGGERSTPKTIAEVFGDEHFVERMVSIDAEGSIGAIADLMLALRLESGLTQDALGSRVGFSGSRIADMEGGWLRRQVGSFKVNTVAQVFEALGLRVELRVVGSLRMAEPHERDQNKAGKRQPSKSRAKVRK